MIFKYNTVTPLFFQLVAALPTRIYFSLFGSFKVEGKENLKLVSSKNVIFACNHTSEWDPILLATVLIGTKFSPLYFVSKSKTKYLQSGWRNNLYGGIFFKLMGAYPLQSASKNYNLALINHTNILNLGKSLCIYPEGYKNTSGTLDKAKGGVGYLVGCTRTPVIPVSITGVVGTKIGNGNLVIKFGKPLYYEDVFPGIENVIIEDCKKGAQKIMDEVGKLLEKSKKG